jgi:hypothetical protein
VAAARELRNTEDYAVETPAGAIGRVEEIRLGPDGRPEALAVRTTDGGRALLRDEDVVAVDREHHWVVVGEHPALAELAGWRPTGEIVHPEPVDRLARIRASLGGHAPDLAGRPLWEQVAILYGGVTVIVVAGVGLVFLIAWLAVGAPY